MPKELEEAVGTYLELSEKLLIQLHQCIYKLLSIKISYRAYSISHIKKKKANVSCTNVFHVINKLLRGLLITVSKFIINSQIQDKGYSCDFQQQKRLQTLQRFAAFSLYKGSHSLTTVRSFQSTVAILHYFLFHSSLVPFFIHHIFSYKYTK